MNKHLFVALAAIIVGGSLSAQPWLANEQNLKAATDHVSFKQQQQLFNAYWKNREVEKGKGYKQFRRWEYFMEPRVSSDGTIHSQELWNAIIAKQNMAPGSETTYSWQADGPTTTPLVAGIDEISGNGRVNCVQFHPTDTNILYIGAPSGGFWKSTNGGESWQTTTDLLDAIGISDIAINPNHPDTIYIATGDGDAGDTYGIGILRSTNGGATWEPTNLALSATNFTYFRRLLMNPNHPNSMIATSNKGIYYTNDGWETYSKYLMGSYKDLEFKPDDYSVVYATSYDNSGRSSVYVSTNGGVTFTKSMSGFSTNNQVNRIELAVTPNNPALVYALASNSSDNGLFGLYVSSDTAKNWTKVYGNTKNLLGWEANGSDAGGQGWYDLSLAVSPDNYKELFVGGVNVWKSTNGGTSWSLSGHWTYHTNADYIHADHHMFSFSPYTGNLYSANDGGIYITYNKGKNWKSISNGLAITQIYKLSTTQNSNKKVLVGSQDNGTYLLSNDEWLNVLGGDGMECIIDYSNDDVLYGSIYYGSIYRSLNGGATFSSIIPSGNPQGAWVTPFILHPQNPNIIYAGYTDVYMSTNKGTSWTQISNNLAGGKTLSTLAIAKSNPNYLYATSGSQLYKTDNNGQTWSTSKGVLPDITITSVAVSDDDPQKLWVSLSGYSEGKKVYQSFDGGTTWTNISNGLPNLPANNLCYRDKSHHELYLGTDVGVYYHNATMNSWDFISTGLPNVIVSELEINYLTQELYAATYGRGVWHTPLPEIAPHPASFASNNSTTCYDGEVMIHYTGNSVFDSLRWNIQDGLIHSHTVNYDTIWLTFTGIGKKNIELQHFYNGISTTNTKLAYVDVVNSIEFNVSPSEIYVCNLNPVSLSVTNNYDYTWSPTELLDTTKGITVQATPQNGTAITVTGINGSCSETKTIKISTVPDNICDALYLPLGGHGPFNNSCAGKETNEPVPPKGSFGDGCNTQDGWCQGEDRIDNSIWFKLTVPPSGSLSIATIGYDNQIALYEAASCSDILDGNYTLLAANDDHSTHNDYSAVLELITGLTPGDTLWLQVDGSFGGAIGSCYITIDSLIDRTSPPPSLIRQQLINVYPNPSEGILNIEFKTDEISALTIDVFDASGNIILTEQLPEHHIFHHQIEVGSQAGVYIIRFRTHKKQLYRKVIVQ